MSLLLSSVYTVPAEQSPYWQPPAKGASLPELTTEGPGWFLATLPELPIPPDEFSAVAQAVIHCAPGTLPPLNVIQTIARGDLQPWPAEAIAAAWPNGSRYVLECTWADIDDDGNPVERRGKIVELPAGKTAIETNIVPHQWAGDGE